MPQRLIYKYSLYNLSDKTTLWEREPSRMLEICDPDGYSLYKHNQVLSKSLGYREEPFQWRNVDQVFLVNGHIEKIDANFITACNFDKIGDEKIFIGPYPQNEVDVNKM